MRVLVLWVDWTGYMDACAKALQRLLDCELDIVCLGRNNPNAPYSDALFFDFPSTHHTLNDETLARIVSKDYDLILICSWNVKAYVGLGMRYRGKAVRVLCMDNQWSGSARQYLGVLAFHTYLRRSYDFAFVPGNRQATFAARLGFGPQEIIEGHLACADGFASQPVAPRNRAFLFAGRFIAEKGVNVLREGWRRYVERNEHSWRLVVCGQGPLGSVLQDLPRTENLGFVQPAELAAVMASCSALVLPSLYEPWGVVVQEAALAGLGLILTQACGAGDNFLRDGLNGRLVADGDPEALCQAFEWFHQLNDADLARVSETSGTLGAQRSPSSWASSVTRALVLARAS